MKSIKKAFSSRTNWTFAGMFAVGGLNAIAGVVSPSAQLFIMALLAALGVYFRTNPKQDF